MTDADADAAFIRVQLLRAPLFPGAGGAAVSPGSGRHPTRLAALNDSAVVVANGASVHSVRVGAVEAPRLSRAKATGFVSAPVALPPSRVDVRVVVPGTPGAEAGVEAPALAELQAVQASKREEGGEQRLCLLVLVVCR